MIPLGLLKTQVTRTTAATQRVWKGKSFVRIGPGIFNGQRKGRPWKGNAFSKTV